jgi:hypothetical protein
MIAHPPGSGGGQRVSEKGVARRTRMLVGGLCMLKSTLSLIEQQARELQECGLVSEADVRRFAELSAEVADLAEKFSAGTFLEDLKPIIRQMRKTEFREN